MCAVHVCWWHLSQGMGVGKGAAAIYSGTMWRGTVRGLQHAGGVTVEPGCRDQVAHAESQCADCESKTPFSREAGSSGKTEGQWLEGCQGGERKVSIPL